MAKRRKGPDTDLLVLGAGAFLFAAAVFFYFGADAVILYGIAAVAGVAFIYQAYM